MSVRSLNHVGIVVDDLDAAISFFAALGVNVQGRSSVDGEWVDRVIGLDGVRSEIVSLRVPGSDVWLELSKFHSPGIDGAPNQPPANRRGLRHLAFVVDEVDATLAHLREMGYDMVGEVQDYEDIYRLCYVRGPEGIIVELAEELGAEERATPPSAEEAVHARVITPNLPVDDIETAKEFYVEFLGLSDEEFNLGWVARFTSPDTGAHVQLVTRDATAPEDSQLSVHVDDVDAAYAEAQRRGYEIVHPLTEEEWGVRRFFVRAPNGSILNIVAHRD
ncbi:hypothetical protein SAMN04489806_0954 [Paramicrobacterium humi]|uniref:VOC domain-containing protein n=1 Tax=Paramicrobacterium humi TaxID=640635 RepID=A0A1H4K072_9MICO|nr:VOC family protein [Microbacterium humi]SEB51959.1 hypothetical protein SAMN04489806_0954 [Microbacterium humi]